MGKMMLTKMQMELLLADVTSDIESGYREFKATDYGVVRLQILSDENVREVIYDGCELVLRGNALKQALGRLKSLNLEPSSLFDKLWEQVFGKLDKEI